MPVKLKAKNIHEEMTTDEELEYEVNLLKEQDVEHTTRLNNLRTPIISTLPTIIETKGTSWSVVDTLTFPGTTNYNPAPTKISVLIRAEGGDTCEVRIVDLTTGLTIAATTFSNASFDWVNFNITGALSTTPRLYDVQTRVFSGKKNIL
jgi:prolyl oligopeptidase PreP (S9A serine peptidase family)